MNKPTPKPASQIILYQTEDNQTRLQVRLDGETVWLTQAQMAELFQRERSVVTKHIRNIFEEGELVEKAVCASYAHTAADGKTYKFRLIEAAKPSAVEKAFESAVQSVKQLEAGKAGQKKRTPKK